MIKIFINIIFSVSLCFCGSLLGAGKMPEAIATKKIGNTQFVKAIGGVGAVPGKFLFPSDVLALDNKTSHIAERFDEILVVDKNNSRIQKFDPSLDFEYSFGTFGKGSGQFNTPWGIVSYAKTRIYISDTLNHRILNYDIKGNYIGLLNCTQPKLTTIDTDKLRFNEPKGIDVGRDGNIYIADSGNDRIVEIAPIGYFICEIKDIEFEAGFLLNPSDVKIDNLGNIFVADTGNNRVLGFDSNQRVILKIENLKSPAGLMVDNEGNIFVSENNKVKIYDINGELIEELDYSFNKPLGLAISGEKKSEKGDIFRNLYIADSGNHKVVLFRIEYNR